MKNDDVLLHMKGAMMRAKEASLSPGEGGLQGGIVQVAMAGIKALSGFSRSLLKPIEAIKWLYRNFKFYLFVAFAGACIYFICDNTFYRWCNTDDNWKNKSVLHQTFCFCLAA